MEHMNPKNNTPRRSTSNLSETSENKQKSKLTQMHRDGEESKNMLENRTLLTTTTTGPLNGSQQANDNKLNGAKKDDENDEKEDPAENGDLLPNEGDLLQQKEENLRRQKQVRQSLEQKTLQLQQEQLRLAKMNAELEAIEQELAKDVEKLREMIDQLSRDIAFWEEDYNTKVFFLKKKGMHFFLILTLLCEKKKKKKKAYLESEKQLTSAKERRDNLTKHLHAIIISNESRKVLF
ncbi:hypothetical protein RFI_25181 [Reticulomyxa filosa]|uniref:Uncharacterized protein n=1 Tax=Reticulomyxa filosa TaxID=46433 RepID=X6ME61_RETFI|nr:hypothetical protein RFI_25181 [Reticulomyxa filosa]|eukprot:ETO12194.1 hypothetical protein RFI_25181 [Reticulomyxa filosa]